MGGRSKFQKQYMWPYTEGYTQVKNWGNYSSKERNGFFEAITGRASSIFLLSLVFNKQLLRAGCINLSPRCFDEFHKAPDNLHSRCGRGRKRRLPRGNDICMESEQWAECPGQRSSSGGENCNWKGLTGDSPFAGIVGEGGACLQPSKYNVPSEQSSILPDLSSVSPSPNLMFLKVSSTIESDWLSLKWASLCY